MSGWGVSSNDQGQPTELLMAAKVLTRDHRNCSRKYEEKNLVIKSTMMCAGGRRGTCKGDSGGPLTCRKGEQPYICGIASWGSYCEDGYHPDVYTDVTKFKEWIQRRWCKIKQHFFNNNMRCFSETVGHHRILL